MDWTTVIVGIGSAFIGGAGSYFTFLGKKKDSFREDFTKIVNELRASIDQMKEDEKQYKSRIKELENEVSLLKNKLVLVQAAQLDMPIPQWIKDTKGTMLALNTAYEETFLLPAGKKSVNYIGSNDYEFWGEEIGEHYSKADKTVLRNKKIWQGTEVVDFGTHKEDWEITKYPIYSGNMIIGIGGIAYRQAITVEDN